MVHHTPAPALPTPAPSRRRWPWILRRWPAWLAVGVSALIWGADASSLSELMVLLPMVYVVVAAVGSRRSTWPALLVCFAAFVGLRAQDQVTPETALLVLAAAALAAGFARRGGRASLLVQAAGMVTFGALALWATGVDAHTARHLVAAGWLAHGIWDLVHLRADRTVTTSYAEWCGVLDVLVGVMLLAG